MPNEVDPFAPEYHTKSLRLVQMRNDPFAPVPVAPNDPFDPFAPMESTEDAGIPEPDPFCTPSEPFLRFYLS